MEPLVLNLKDAAALLGMNEKQPNLTGPQSAVGVRISEPLADAIEKFNHALTAIELAKFFRVNKLTIYRLAQAGTLPSFRVGTCVRFEPKAVASWLRERGAL